MTGGVTTKKEKEYRCYQCARGRHTTCGGSNCNCFYCKHLAHERYRMTHIEEEE